MHCTMECMVEESVVSKTVVGLFDTKAQAQAAIYELIIDGFPRDRIYLRQGGELIRGDQGRVGIGGQKVEGFMGRALDSIFQSIGLLKPPPPLVAMAGGIRVVGIHPDAMLVIIAIDDEKAEQAAEIFGSYHAAAIIQQRMA